MRKIVKIFFLMLILVSSPRLGNTASWSSALEDQFQSYVQLEEIRPYLILLQEQAPMEQERETDSESEVAVPEEPKSKSSFLWLGILGAVLVVGIIGYILFATKKSSKISIDKIEPNPFVHDVSISYSLPQEANDPQILIHNLSGEKVKSIPIAVNSCKLILNLEELEKGAYVFSILDGIFASNKVNAIKK